MASISRMSCRPSSPGETIGSATAHDIGHPVNLPGELVDLHDHAAQACACPPGSAYCRCRSSRGVRGRSGHSRTPPARPWYRAGKSWSNPRRSPLMESASAGRSMSSTRPEARIALVGHRPGAHFDRLLVEEIARRVDAIRIAPPCRAVRRRRTSPCPAATYRQNT